MSFGQALLNWTTAFSNFDQTAQDLRWFGWSQATVAEPCSWTGVSCTAQSAGLVLPLESGLTGRSLTLLAVQMLAAVVTRSCVPRSSLHLHIIRAASDSVKAPCRQCKANAQHCGQHDFPHILLLLRLRTCRHFQQCLGCPWTISVQSGS